MPPLRLGFPILSYNEIRLDEQVPGLGLIPAFFFERQYVAGVVTDKIPISCYKNPNFIKSLSGLLGGAATFTLVLGRASPRTGKIFYDDGDEVIQLNSRSIPTRLIIIETTGSFTDWTTPLLAMLPQCLTRFRAHLDKALESGVPPASDKRGRWRSLPRRFVISSMRLKKLHSPLLRISASCSTTGLRNREG